MSKVGKAVGIVLSLLLFAVLTYMIAPRIGSWVSKYFIKQTAASGVVENDDSLKTVSAFLNSLKTATQYSFSGTKNVTGPMGPYSMEFICSVNGDNYAVQTVKNTNTLRQLYVDGKYTLLDDTAKKEYEDFLYIGFPDMHMREALTGKLIRTKGGIINGNQVNCIELYKNGTVYAFYLNQQGALVRSYYIYDSNEITIDFSKAEIGSKFSVSFDIPPGYAKGERSEITNASPEASPTSTPTPTKEETSTPSPSAVETVTQK